MTDESRKASDVLLLLEEKVNLLIKISSVYDMNIKLILDRVNKVYSYIEKLQAELDQEMADSNQSNIISVKPEDAIQLSENPIINRRAVVIPQAPINVPSSTVNTPLQTENRPIDSDKKVAVIQRITDDTGKDLFMADVVILDENGKVFAKTKTNAAGKWQAHLKPGNYIVKITKTNTATKELINGTQNITVSNSDSILTLKIAALSNKTL